MVKIRKINPNEPAASTPQMSLDETDIFTCNACPDHGCLLYWGPECKPATCKAPHGETEGFWTAIENADGWRKVVCAEHQDAIKAFLNFCSAMGMVAPDGK